MNCSVVESNIDLMEILGFRTVTALSIEAPPPGTTVSVASPIRGGSALGSSDAVAGVASLADNFLPGHIRFCCGHPGGKVLLPQAESVKHIRSATLARHHSRNDVIEHSRLVALPQSRKSTNRDVDVPGGRRRRHLT